jgi:type IV pilus assembly protein PilF
MTKQMLQGMMIVVCVLPLLSCAKSGEKTNDASAKVSTPLAGQLSAENFPDRHKAALVNVELGLGYLGQGQVARAKTKLTHAVKLAPNLSETHSALAHFWEMVGEFKDAEREHKKAVRLSGVGAVYNNYGAYLCRRGRYKEADKAFHAAIEDKNYPRTAEVYENAGLCALKSSNVEKADEYLSTAFRRDPSRVNTLMELSDIHLKKGELNQAKQLLEQYKKVAEPSARSLWLGIQIAKNTADNNTVASNALMLKNLFEDSPEYQLYLNAERAHQ